MQCHICQKETTSSCSACKSVAYCCVEHQKLDWKNHKKLCKSISRNMDSHQPVNKKISSNVSSFQNQDVVTTSEGGESVKTEGWEPEILSPLEMGSILEKIFSFLDVDSIKNARQVNDLWSFEGARLLLTKCFVKIPSGLRDGDLSMKNKARALFKDFLSIQSNGVSKISHITIEAVVDLKLWKSLKVLGPQVSSLKLKIIDDKAELLSNLLNLLPNLKYLTFQDMDCLRFENRKGPIITVLTTEMSQAKKDGKPLVISRMILPCFDVYDLEDMEKLSNCKNIKFEELKFSMKPFGFSNVPDFKARIANAMNKLLSTSQNTLQRLDLTYCDGYLSLLHFSRMTTLTHISLQFEFFNQEAQDPKSCYKFSPSVIFSENFPSLTDFAVEYDKDVEYEPEAGASAKFFRRLFQNTGQVRTLKRFKYSDNYWDLEIEPLFKIFPNVEEFHAVISGCSQKMFQSLFHRGKDLKKLCLWIHLDGIIRRAADLDSVLTGFPLEVVHWIKKHPTMTAEEFDKFKLESWKFDSSILDLKGLQDLTIRFYCSAKRKRFLPETMLDVAGKFAFKSMSSDTRITIDVQNCKPTPESVRATLKKVAKLPNVIIHY